MSENYISVVTVELITCGTLLGPLPLTSGSPDSLAILTWRCVDNLPTSKQVLKVTLKDHANGRGVYKVPAWLVHILPARNPEEQTLEVIVKGGQLYFRALRDILTGEELRAWFGEDLADVLKLPMIPPNVIEGEKCFECMLCQEQFENPFPVVSHLMYRCKRKEQAMTPTHCSPRKKNGGRVKNFDIATLTDMNDGEVIHSDDQSPLDVVTPPETIAEPPEKRKKKLGDFSDEGSTLPKRSRDSQVDPTPKVSKSNGTAKMPPSGTGFSPLHTTVEYSPTESNGSSAFKKVDKSSTSSLHSGLFPGSLAGRELLFHTGPNAFSPFTYPLPPAASSLPQPVQPVEVHLSSAFSPSDKLSTSTGSLDLLPRKMSEGGYELGALMPPPRVPQFAPKPMDTFGAKFPAPLLPFLPPSLAALSFPTQNWCARCNASFRMTSDLVYHMRSHHKRETDPQKLKREEKLRCQICNETFRERHHLTRHMTSHQ